MEQEKELRNHCTTSQATNGASINISTKYGYNPQTTYQKVK